eukprot:353632-Chlamydomonas_euryale.AAC.10
MSLLVTSNAVAVALSAGRLRCVPNSWAAARSGDKSSSYATFAGWVFLQKRATKGTFTDWFGDAESNWCGNRGAHDTTLRWHLVP